MIPNFLLHIFCYLLRAVTFPFCSYRIFHYTDALLWRTVLYVPTSSSTRTLFINVSRLCSLVWEFFKKINPYFNIIIMILCSFFSFSIKATHNTNMSDVFIFWFGDNNMCTGIVTFRMGIYESESYFRLMIISKLQSRPYFI